MEKSSVKNSSLMRLTRFMVGMEPRLSQSTAQKIIHSLKGKTSEEKDEMAETALKVLQMGMSEKETLEALNLCYTEG